MNLIENGQLSTGPDGFVADVPTAQEAFVRSVYVSVDDAIACELDRLQSEEGIVPSCKKGCCHCCRHHILTDIAEVHTLAQYVKREFSEDQISELRIRTHQWHAWDNSRPGRTPLARVNEQVDLSNYVRTCPLLVEGACSVYPVRPVVCRAHLVSSHPQLCLAVHTRDSTAADPAVLKSVMVATSPFSQVIKDHIEHKGLNFPESQMLLPHGLALEMGWDFAIVL